MNLIAKFLKVISSETNPWQIAFAIMFGMIVGFTPLLRLHNLLVLLLVFFFRVNIASFIIAVTFFSGLAMALDPLMLSLGETILTAPALQDAWRVLYDTTVGRLSLFNHTLTMGSLVVSLLLAPVVLLLSRFLIIRYRDSIMVRVNRLRIVHVLKASSLFQRMSGLGD